MDSELISMSSPISTRRYVQPGGSLLSAGGIFVIALVALGSFARTSYAWGPSAHRLVNSWAIETLPSPLREFFNANRDYLTERASDPDRTMRQDRNEWQSHYMYLDKYGSFPYPNLPHSFQRAVVVHGSRKINRNGLLPWRIGEYSLYLTNAFKAEDWEAVRFNAALLGHYVTDAHQPLHTSSNFDGQLSGQSGLANRYGSSLIDRYIAFFIMNPENATQIEDPTENAFEIALESHTWTDNILLADLQARTGQVDYTDEYYDILYSRVSSMVMQQINAACHEVGSSWYTAWVNAGRPALPTQ